MSEEVVDQQTDEQTASRSDSRRKTYRIKVRSIVANTNPRNPLPVGLKKQGWKVFDGEQAVWPLATSDDPLKRAKFVELMQTDEEFVFWASTFITQGQLQPVRLRDNGDRTGKGNNTYTLVYGCRRCLAILYNWCVNGKPAEPIVEGELVKGSNLNLLHMADTENTYMPPPAIEQAEAIRNAINQGCTEEEVARARGLSMATVKNRLALLDLEPEVQRKLRSGAITPTKALKAASESATNGYVGEPSSNGHAKAATEESSEPKIKVRPKKEILKAMDEYAPGTETHRALSWALGLREDLK